ncbi:MAG: PaaI family thioesterase [Acidobacteriota bacterium]|nr:PaaI family thioesterase [Acidobacteriota bacterium]
MTIDEVRKVFAADKYLTMTGVVIEEAGGDRCRCSMKVLPMHFNAGGAVQGGAIYTLADSAFAVASNIGHLERGEDLLTVSQSASISYLRAGGEGTLYATAQKVGGGKRSSVFRMEVADADGNIIAIMTGNGCTVPRKK